MTTMDTTDRGTTVPPERSLEQRLDALKTANRIRMFRAGAKRELKAAPRRAALSVLLDPPPEMETMKIFDLLLSMPKVGRVKANRALNTCRISPSKTIGGMTDRQRNELARVLTP